MKIFAYFLLGLLTFWQNKPVLGQKWGKVAKEILLMKSIPEDSEADAVVLFDIGKMRITQNFELKFKRHQRIKILTERGKRYADISIDYWHEDKIKGLKAHTILPNGKKVKLDKKQIFEESEEFWKRKVFAMPGVEVGSVIEYQYEKVSEYLTFLDPWYFQHEEYTKLSEMTVLLPPEFSYQIFFINTRGKNPEPQKDRLVDPDRQGKHLYN